MNTFDELLDRASRWLKYLDSPANPVVDEMHAGLLYVVILLLDISGSMNTDDYPPSRLAGAKQAAIRYLEQCAEFRPETVVGIVSFGSAARIEARPQPVRQNLRALRRAAHGLAAQGGTNTASGLKLARRTIASVPRETTGEIILLSDGHQSEGGDPVAESQRVKANGITLSIIGIGGSPLEVNEADMKEMASVVNGELRYWFIRSVGELVKRFEALALREIEGSAPATLRKI